MLKSYLENEQLTKVLKKYFKAHPNAELDIDLAQYGFTDGALDDLCYNYAVISVVEDEIVVTVSANKATARREYDFYLNDVETKFQRPIERILIEEVQKRV